MGIPLLAHAAGTVAYPTAGGGYAPPGDPAWEGFWSDTLACVLLLLKAGANPHAVAVARSAGAAAAEQPTTASLLVQSWLRSHGPTPSLCRIDAALIKAELDWMTTHPDFRPPMVDYYFYGRPLMPP